MESAQPYRYRGYAMRLFAGDDGLSNLRPEVERLGASRAFIACGQSVATGTDLVDRAKHELGELVAGVFDGVQAESPIPSVEAGADAARAAGADCVIAIGGGSAAVTARGMVILLAEGRPLHELATTYPPGQLPVSPRLNEPKLPIILVLTLPTTAMLRAGSALKDVDRMRRVELFDPKTRAAAIIWDTAAVLTPSLDLFLNTCATNYGGAVSGLATTNPNPVAHGDRVQAYRLLDEHIPRLLEAPEDGAVRMQLMAAGYLLNRAADIEPLGGGSRARLSSLSATGGPINTRYQCGQGACSAVLTPATLRYSLETAERELAALGRAMGAASVETPEPEAARAAVDAVGAFFRETGMPSRLRDIGVPREEIELIAEDTMGSFFLRHDGRTEEHKRELIEMLNEVW